MIIAVCFIVGFSLIQMLIASINLISIEKINKLESDFNGLVSILIPARNEELNIGNLLADLQKQNYQCIEIIVFDDQSTDNTVKIVKQFIESDKRIKLIESVELPIGWFGKNYACHEMSKQAKGKYLLFLDADVHIKKNIILHSITLSEMHNLGLLSIFPIQQMKTIGEKITVPNMNYILLTLLPLILVRKTKYKSIAAANGQFMLFQTEIYQSLCPHQKMKSNKVEDIEIARYYKKLNFKIACLTGDDSVTCRMYHGFNESVNGFSKNLISFFGNSFILAFLFWLITTVGFIIVYIGASVYIFSLYLITLFIIRILVSVSSKQNVFTNILLIIPQQITLGIILYNAGMNRLKKKYKWKGRNIS